MAEEARRSSAGRADVESGCFAIHIPFHSAQVFVASQPSPHWGIFRSLSASVHCKLYPETPRLSLKRLVGMGSQELTHGEETLFGNFSTGNPSVTLSYMGLMERNQQLHHGNNRCSEKKVGENPLRPPWGNKTALLLLVVKIYLVFITLQ